jgi:hypothetical protein
LRLHVTRGRRRTLHGIATHRRVGRLYDGAVTATGSDDVTTFFGVALLIVLATVAALVLRRGSESTLSRIVVLLLVGAIGLTAYLYNVIPGLTVTPDEHARAVCDRGEDLRNEGDTYYRWNVLEHEWTCHDNWSIVPGISGV